MTVGPVFTPGFTVRGRCKIQMLSCSSAATLDTWPSVHPFGILGHDESTANLGTSRLEPERASALVECVPETTNAAIKPTPAQTNSIRLIFMRSFPPFTLTTYLETTFRSPAVNFMMPWSSATAPVIVTISVMCGQILALLLA